MCTPVATRQRPASTRQTTFHVYKTRGCYCSFRLLMMGGVSPETCWASYKYGIINFWYTVASCWIYLFELYYDARIHEHQVQPINRSLNGVSVCGCVCVCVCVRCLICVLLRPVCVLNRSVYRRQQISLLRVPCTVHKGYTQCNFAWIRGAWIISPA
jgi:hypothetical protein